MPNPLCYSTLWDERPSYIAADEWVFILKTRNNRRSSRGGGRLAQLRATLKGEIIYYMY